MRKRNQITWLVDRYTTLVDTLLGKTIRMFLDKRLFCQQPFNLELPAVFGGYNQTVKLLLLQNVSSYCVNLFDQYSDCGVICSFQTFAIAKFFEILHVTS